MRGCGLHVGINRTLETAATSAVDFYTSVAIGANGNPIISHLDGNTSTVIWSCTCALMRPAPPAPTKRSKTAGDGRLVLVGCDLDGNPIISHHDNTTGDLEV